MVRGKKLSPISCTLSEFLKNMEKIPFDFLEKSHYNTEIRENWRGQ